MSEGNEQKEVLQIKSGLVELPQPVINPEDVNQSFNVINDGSSGWRRKCVWWLVHSFGCDLKTKNSLERVGWLKKEKPWLSIHGCLVCTAIVTNVQARPGDTWACSRAAMAAVHTQGCPSPGSLPAKQAHFFWCQDRPINNTNILHFYLFFSLF